MKLGFPARPVTEFLVDPEDALPTSRNRSHREDHHSLDLPIRLEPNHKLHANANAVASQVSHRLMHLDGVVMTDLGSREKRYSGQA